MNELSETSLRDIKKSNISIVILLAAVLIGAAIYLLANSLIHAAIVVGLVLFILSLYHTPVALMALLVFFPLEGASEMAKVGAGSRLIGLLVMASYLINRFRLKIILPREIIPIFLFNWFAIMSYFWALNQQVTFYALIPLTLNVIMIFVMINTIKDERNFRYLMWAVFIGASITSIMILSGSINYAAGGEKMGRVVLSEGTNPNILGNSILFGFLCGFYLFNEKDKIMRLLFIGMGPVMLYCILLTQNRTALGAAVVAPILGFIFSAKGKYVTRSVVSILVIVLIGISMGVTVLYTDVLTQDAKERMKESGGDLEGSGRMNQWRHSIEFLSERPFGGWGYKNFPQKFDPHFSVRSAHNNFFAIAAEMGFIGLLIWLSIYFICFIRVFKISHPPLKWLMMTMLVFNFMIGMTSTSIIRKGYWYSLGFVLLASTVTYLPTEKEIKEEQELIAKTTGVV